MSVPPLEEWLETTHIPSLADLEQTWVEYKYLYNQRYTVDEFRGTIMGLYGRWRSGLPETWRRELYDRLYKAKPELSKGYYLRFQVYAKKYGIRVAVAKKKEEGYKRLARVLAEIAWKVWKNTGVIPERFQVSNEELNNLLVKHHKLKGLPRARRTPAVVKNAYLSKESLRNFWTKE